jgi:iron complex transport system substrate-binding protein
MIFTQPPRIVSLIASSTEIVCALGMRDFLVGISHECDFPKDVQSLPVCTGPKFVPDGTSYEIDQKVKAILQESLSVYRVDASLLEKLQPTHIITQSQCEVCAVSLKDVEAAACRLLSSQPEIVSLEPNCLADVWSDIRKVGTVLAIPDRAEQLISACQHDLGQIEERIERNSHGTWPRVLFIEWIDPLMTGGNWMPELIDIAGGLNQFGETGKHSPPLGWDAVIKADPEVIVVSPCGFDVKRALEDMNFLTSKSGWDNLSAVRTGRVFVADGNQFFNRPGPRLLESAEILAELFHPHLFDFNHRATGGWIPFAVSPSMPPKETLA